MVENDEDDGEGDEPEDQQEERPPHAAVFFLECLRKKRGAESHNRSTAMRKSSAGR